LTVIGNYNTVSMRVEWNTSMEHRGIISSGDN